MMDPDPQQERFFQDPSIPDIEIRYSTGSERTYKPHFHKTFSIGAIETGSVTYWVEGEESVLKPGELALINPEALHSCNVGKKQKRNYYMMHVSKSYCARIQQSLWGVSEFVPLSCNRVDDEDLYRHFLETVNQLMAETHHHLLEKEQLLADLMLRIFATAEQTKPLKILPSAIHESAKSMLEDDLQKDLSIEELAKQLEVNPFTLIRQFKTVSGSTPHAYRMNCRIEEAKHCLKNGKSLVDTALTCGFFDQSHFHRNFKAITAVTPREYQVNFVQ